MEENFFEEKKPVKATGMLNVLTILTFIGSGIGILGSIWQFINADKSVAEMEKAMNDPNFAQMPGFVKGMMSPEMLEIAKAQAANKIPVLLIGLIGAALCVYGAMEMRKLKMQGYFVYLLGEILPLLAMVIILGTGVVTGMFWFGVAIVALFVILYTTQRSQLINK